MRPRDLNIRKRDLSRINHPSNLSPVHHASLRNSNLEYVQSSDRVPLDGTLRRNPRVGLYLIAAGATGKCGSPLGRLSEVGLGDGIPRPALFQLHRGILVFKRERPVVELLIRLVIERTLEIALLVAVILSAQSMVRGSRDGVAIATNIEVAALCSTRPAIRRVVFAN